MDKNSIEQKIRQERFVKNNGKVLRTINMYRDKFMALSDLRFALEPNLSAAEIIDCVNYLSESNFIRLRKRYTHEDTILADTDFDEIEAKLSADGIKLLAGRKTDECIEI